VSTQTVPTEKSFMVRFPQLPGERAAVLAKALDYERCAGNYERGGKSAEAEHMRAQARAAWEKYRSACR
jgi:hypothetical protein